MRLNLCFLQQRPGGKPRAVALNVEVNSAYNIYAVKDSRVSLVCLHLS